MLIVAFIVTILAGFVSLWDKYKGLRKKVSKKEIDTAELRSDIIIPIIAFIIIIIGSFANYCTSTRTAKDNRANKIIADSLRKRNDSLLTILAQKNDTINSKANRIITLSDSLNIKANNSNIYLLENRGLSAENRKISSTLFDVYTMAGTYPNITPKVEFEKLIFYISSKGRYSISGVKVFFADSILLAYNQYISSDEISRLGPHLRDSLQKALNIYSFMPSLTDDVFFKAYFYDQPLPHYPLEYPLYRVNIPEKLNRINYIVEIRWNYKSFIWTILLIRTNGAFSIKNCTLSVVDNVM